MLYRVGLLNKMLYALIAHIQFSVGIGVIAISINM